MERWQAEGKLALRSPTQSESASFQWRQQDEQTRIELSGPLGANATILNSDGQQLEILQGSERSVWDLTDPRTLAEDSGWYLPLEALPYWLRGVPAPQYPVEQLELADQRLVLLAQAGWTVSYEEYAGFDGFALPTRLQIRGQGRSVRLIIRRWSPGSLP
jgi:outer membrane lipoprotein LolB